jgi:2-keto-4-pentenoate hydratase/2-oxohepta-3-ene-1,7-dioic acid hydratase in catechol pathway
LATRGYTYRESALARTSRTVQDALFDAGKTWNDGLVPTQELVVPLHKPYNALDQGCAIKMIRGMTCVMSTGDRDFIEVHGLFWIVAKVFVPFSVVSHYLLPHIFSGAGVDEPRQKITIMFAKQRHLDADD